MLCTVCGKELNRAQYSSDEKLKSCPNCSTNNGEQHVYYSYPEEFGTTDNRSTPVHPEGPQSYCNDCRAENDADESKAIYCRDVNK